MSQQRCAQQWKRMRYRGSFAAAIACRQPGIPIEFALLCAVLILVAFTGCNRGETKAARLDAPPDPCALVLTPTADGSATDEQVEHLQQEIRQTRRPGAKLEQLGWLYVSRARTKSDPGFYKLAEQTAACMEQDSNNSAEALLLQGHVLENLHRFQEAEQVARQLVSRRESPFDYGLLGDALMEQGRLEEATAAYQKMLDLRPGLESYSRAAHLRWLYGDLAGAIELMRLAARAGSLRNAEPTAWAESRLAIYELQAGQDELALQVAQAALEIQPDYAPALLAKGRVLLAQGARDEAIRALQKAARLNPLPEYQWLLADALRSAGRLDEAQPLEAEIEKRGPVSDPRTASLYLATRRRNVETALRLAQRELGQRADVFTYDALAWSLHVAGDEQRAYETMQSALKAGTSDARLFLHAALIAAASNRAAEAARYRKKANSLRRLLLPSELEWLEGTPLAARAQSSSS